MSYIKVQYNAINCKWCFTQFIPNRRDKQFCCKACYKLYGKKFKGHSSGDIKAQRKRANTIHHPYRQYKKDQCDHCGFIALHTCQLDIDHIDGNHLNNDPLNLQTLCANCHRLKTALQLNW